MFSRCFLTDSQQIEALARQTWLLYENRMELICQHVESINFPIAMNPNRYKLHKQLGIISLI